MQGNEYLGKLGDLLGEARQELKRNEFLAVLAFFQEFTLAMYDVETREANLSKHAIEGISEKGRQYVTTTLRQVGIEL